MQKSNKYAPTADELEFARQSMPVQKVQKSTSKYAPTDEEMAFATSSEVEPEEEKELGSFKSKINAATKGLIKGIAGFGEQLGQQFFKEDPLADQGTKFGEVYGIDITSPETQKFRKENQFKPISDEEKQDLEDQAEKKFPSNEGLFEDILERTGEIAPTALAGPGSIIGKAARTGIAAGAGQLAKSKGYGEGTQSVIEMLSFASPSLSRRLIGSNARQQELIDFGRRHGMTEAQIVPGAFEQTNWRNRLARWANKSGSTQERLEESRDAVNNVFETLRTSPDATRRVSRRTLVQAMQDIGDQYQNLYPSQKRQVAPSIIELLQSRGRGSDFIRYYQSINHEVTNPREYGRFQEATRRALDNISPEIGSEFRLANRFATNRYNAAHRLRPPAHPDGLNFVKGFGAVMGLFSGDWTLFKAAVGAIGGKKLATEFLLNPRLQNLTTKTIDALNNNKIELARQTFQHLRELSKDDSPEFYDETKDFDVKVLSPENPETSKQKQPK